MPGAIAYVQGRQDSHTSEHTGRDIGDRNADALWFAFNLSRHCHEARFGLSHEIVAGARDVGAVLPVAADRAVNQARISGAQRFVVQSLPFQGAWAEVLDQHCRAADKPKQPLLVLRDAEIQRNAVLVTIQSQVIGAFPGDIGRSELARIITLAWL